jgi:hypothetical protein
MSRQDSLEPTDRDVPDRGPAPFAPDFVGDAVNVARGSIDAGSGGALVAAIALAAVLGALDLLTACARPSPAPMAAAATPAFEPLAAALVKLPIREAPPRSAQASAAM